MFKIKILRPQKTDAQKLKRSQLLQSIPTPKLESINQKNKR